MDNMLLILLFVIALTILINTMMRKLFLPTILGYMFTGIIVSQIYKIASGDKILLSHISEFGIVFLMFTIGLEFSIKHLSSMKKEVFVYGFLQLFLTTFIFGAICYLLLSFDLKSSIIIGSALSLSSTAIIIKMLEEKRDLQKRYGRKVLGILLFQDIAVIPLLLMISIFANKNSNISDLLLQTAYSAIIVLLVIFIIGKYLLNGFLRIITSLKTYEIFIASIFLIVIGSSYIAHFFGFSYTLGAFLSGMMIAETKYKYQIEADLIPFRDILLGVFFITVGMQIDFNILADNIFLIFGIVIFIMFIKFLSLFAALSFFAQKRTALKTALALCQIGEFSIVILELARSNNLLNIYPTQILLISVIISMIISPFIVKNIRFLADILSKDEVSEKELQVNSAKLSNHIIVCGYGSLGKTVCKKIAQKNIRFIVVEHDITLVKEAIDDGCLAIFGNAAMPSIIKALNTKDAISAIVAIDNEEKLQIVCEALRENSKKLNIVVHAKDLQSKNILQNSADHILLGPDLTASLLVDEAVSCRVNQG